MNWKSGGRRAALPSSVARKRGCVRRGRRIGWASRLAVTACVLTGGCSVASGRPVAATPAAAARTATARAAVAPFVYAADRHTGGVSQFGSSLSGSGALRPLTPKTVASGRTPTATAVSPQGTSVYVVDDFVISQYSDQPCHREADPQIARDRAYRTRRDLDHGRPGRQERLRGQLRRMRSAWR